MSLSLALVYSIFLLPSALVLLFPREMDVFNFIAFYKKKKKGFEECFEKNEGLWSLILIIHFVFKCPPPA